MYGSHMCIMAFLTIMVDEVGHPVGHNYRQDDAKQIVNPSCPFHHEHNQRDGRSWGRGKRATE